MNLIFGPSHTILYLDFLWLVLFDHLVVCRIWNYTLIFWMFIGSYVSAFLLSSQFHDVLLEFFGDSYSITF